MGPFLRFLVAGFLTFFAQAASAVAAAFLVDGYSVRVWQTDDGLPQNLVTSATQTRDGYLWFGTYGGLTRFDGERFETFSSVNSPGLSDPRIVRLFEDAGGTLWLGHDSGTVTRYNNGRFEPVSLASGGAGEGRIIGLGGDEKGRGWAMQENGSLVSVDGGTRLPSLIGSERPAVMAWSRSAQGNIWVAENGRVAQLIDGRLRPVSLPPGPSNYAMSLAATEDGGTWIFCDGRIRKWKNDRWTEDRGAYPWPAEPSGAVASALELRDGTLAIGTIYSGLYLVFADGRRPVRFDLSNGLPQNWVRFLFEDREGNLWAGAGSAGLVSIHPTAFSVLSLPSEAKGCSVLSVAPAPDGSLWVGTDGASLYHYSDETWRHYGATAGLDNWFIPAVTVSPQGEVWASAFWWGGPYRLEQERFVRPAGIEPTSHPAYALLATGEPGGMLIGNRDGLRHWQDGRATWLVKSPAGLAAEASTLAQDRDGAIWCGFTQGGLVRVTRDRLTTFRPADGLASDAVRTLCIDDDGILWVGTADRGLSRFKDGRFANLGRAHGLADDSICAILDDGRGYLWLSTHHGLQRIPKDELNRCADGAATWFSSQVYDRNDGLPIVEFTSGFQAVACKTPDGRLWFASGKGLISVDPARIASNPIRPPVVIDSLWQDGQAVAVAAGRLSQRLPPDHQRLEFRFSGLSFTAPNKVQFKYRLEGIDDTWVDAGTRRSAFYSRLPAGPYRFRVIACNNDGIWNTDGALLAFTVDPFFWETWWFIGACLLIAASVIAWLARFFTRRRMQRKIEQMKRQQEIEQERARIAQDIHDDVGASLSRIAMLSQPAHADLAEAGRLATTLSSIYSTAREVTRSLDEIVWAVDPRHDTLDSIVDYMGKFAQSFLAPTTLRLRLDLPVVVPAWPLTAEVRHNLFLAFKEALHNAAKHAGATELRISLRVEHDAFVIGVKDNGTGFTPTNRPRETDRIASGRGLVNMESRLKRIGGRCEISSTADTGTSVLFIVAVGNDSARALTTTAGS